VEALLLYHNGVKRLLRQRKLILSSCHPGRLCGVYESRQTPQQSVGHLNRCPLFLQLRKEEIVAADYATAVDADCTPKIKSRRAQWMARRKAPGRHLVASQVFSHIYFMILSLVISHSERERASTAS